MAEKSVATEDVGTIGQLSAAQTAKLAEFGQGLQQSALEALSTTLDKKLEGADAAGQVVAAAAVPSQLAGMFVIIDAEVVLEDGTRVPAMLVIGEDEASALFNVAPEGASESDYKGQLEEAVQTAITDLSDFLTLSVSVNSGAQLQFGVTAVQLRNTAMTPLQLPAAMGSAVLNIQLPVTVDGGPIVSATYLMPVDALGRVLAAVDSSESVGGPAAAAAPSAARTAPAPAAGQQPALTPLPTGHQEPKEAVVRPAQFTSFASQGEAPSMTNIDLILDVQLRVTVELGRKLLSVRDILALGPGSVVELDKVAGEPVDVLVNDRLIATGEVVVADDNFGVRITDIVNPAKRLSSR